MVEVGGSVGGGTYPGVSLRSWALELTASSVADLGVSLRNGDPPVIARVMDNRLILDVRTVLPGQEKDLIDKVSEALVSLVEP